MNPRTTTILGWLTLIAVLVAIWLTLGERQPPREKAGKFWPDLAARINDAAEVSITHEGRHVTLARDGALWRIREKDGYPADGEKLRRFLMSLVRTEILAYKTDRPADYPRLELDEAKAAHVVVKDAHGSPFVDAYIGKREFKFRARRFETFVRKADGPQVYLVTGLDEAKAEARPWFPDSVLAVDFSRVAAVTVTHADGERLAISRPAPGEDYALAGMAEDETFKGYRPLDHVANAFSLIAFTDVRRDEGKAPGTPVGHVRLATFDGLVVDIDAYETGDETGDQWWRIKAEASPGARSEEQGEPAGKAAKTGSPGADQKTGAGEGENGDGDADHEGRDADSQQPDPAAEVARLRPLSEGWLLRISKHTADDIFKRRSQLVTKADEAGKSDTDAPDREGDEG